MTISKIALKRKLLSELRKEGMGKKESFACVVENFGTLYSLFGSDVNKMIASLEVVGN